MKNDNSSLLDELGEVMDSFLKNNKIQLLVESPKGSSEWTTKSNIDELGPVVYFYILLNLMPIVFQKFKDILDENLTESFVDSVLDMVKKEIMETVMKEGDDAEGN